MAEPKFAQGSRAGVVKDADEDAPFGPQATGERDAAPLGREGGEEHNIAAGLVAESGYSDAESGRGTGELAREEENASDHMVRSAFGFGGDGLLGNQGAIGVAPSVGDLRSAQVHGRVEHRNRDTVVLD